MQVSGGIIRSVSIDKAMENAHILDDLWFPFSEKEVFIRRF